MENNNNPDVKKRAHLPGYVKFSLCLALLLTALLFLRMELRVSGSFIILPQHNADVRAQVEGIIEKVYADQGDIIIQGAVLARLSDRDFSAELRKVEAEIEAKEALFKLLKAGPRPEEIEVARTQMAKAEERFRFGREYLERDKVALELNLISKREFEETKEQAAIREKELQEAGERLKILRAGSRQEEIDALQADIRRLKAHENHLQDQLELLTVTSPITGVVTTPKLNERIGENVKKGELIAEVYELTTVIAEIAVPEKEIGDVKVGQQVRLKARSYPGVTFQGNVTAIAPIATKPATEWESERTVLVTTTLDNKDGLLKPEMTGNAKIYSDDYRLLDLLTRRFIRYLRVEFWSWW